MEFKIVISDPKTGKSYNKEVKEADAKGFSGKRLGDEFDGSALGLTGYKLKIRGGSDKSGFPMKKGIQKSVERVLMSDGVGYNPKREVRRRKRVRGETINQDIIQINTVIVTHGPKKLEDVFGKPPEESTDGEADKSPEGEKKSEETKPKESKKEETPKAAEDVPKSPEGKTPEVADTPKGEAKSPEGKTPEVADAPKGEVKAEEKPKVEEAPKAPEEEKKSE